MAMSNISKLVLAFVTLILGIVFAAQVADLGQDITATTGVSNEVHAFTIDSDLDINETAVYTLTNNPTNWKVEDCPITNLVIMNGSSDTALTLTTDYIPTLSAGTFTLVNTTETAAMVGADNNTYISYSYCGDDYMNLGWGRTGINLVPGFFALALLLISVGLFYSIAKENGIMN